MSDQDLDFLVAAATEGDSKATAELIRRTEHRVHRLCRILGSPATEDDLVQETYLRALRALPSYRGDSSFVSWLAAIARNVCADDVRRSQRQRRLLERLRPTVAGHDLPPGVTHHLLDQLDDDRRNAFVLTQCIGFSYADAAAALDCPVGTIRSRVARARGDLLELLNAAEPGTAAGQGTTRCS